MSNCNVFQEAVSYLKFIHISFKKYPSGKQSLNFSVLQIKPKAVCGAKNIRHKKTKGRPCKRHWIQKQVL